MRHKNTILSVVFASMMLGASPIAWAGLSPGQTSWYGQALRANARNQFSPPQESAAPASDPIAEKIIWWDRLRRPAYKASFMELSRFLTQNPGWPLEQSLRISAENAIVSTKDSPEAINAFFNRFPPITPTGKIRRAEALAALGQKDASIVLARSAWTSGGLSPTDETAALNQFGPVFTPADHYARADAVLWSRSYARAERLKVFLSDDQKALIEARIALQARMPTAPEKLALVPAALRANAGLIYDQALALRNTDENAVIALILSTHINPEDVLKPRAWAMLLQDLSRKTRERGDFDLAYRLLSEHNMADSAPDSLDEEADRSAYVETEWTAGWIALRYLRRPTDAIRHFAAMQPVAQNPITLARSAYWAGRSAEALNNATLARQWYARAAQFPDVFYGQLATDKLGRPIVLPDSAQATIDPEALKAFLSGDVVRAARLLGELGEDTLQSFFITALAKRANSLEERRGAADLAQEIQRPDLGVRIGKLARVQGYSFIQAAYPSLPLPDVTNMVWSLVHGITRQESLFNTNAISRAGARGLMQLMPATARMVSRKIGLSYDPGRLLSDPAYNVILGTSYIQNRLESYGGNHVLAIASYNAGPGNVAKWIAANGDPRNPSVDVIDWIEKIPFKETRDYVMRVLENTVVYSLIDPNQRHQNTAYLLTKLLGREPGRP